MTARKLHVACVQLRSTDDVQENIALTSALIRAAHKDGAQFIATPENTARRIIAFTAGPSWASGFTARGRARSTSSAGSRSGASSRSSPTRAR